MTMTPQLIGILLNFAAKNPWVIQMIMSQLGGKMGGPMFGGGGGWPQQQGGGMGGGPPALPPPPGQMPKAKSFGRAAADLGIDAAQLAGIAALGTVGKGISAAGKAAGLGVSALAGTPAAMARVGTSDKQRAVWGDTAGDAAGKVVQGLGNAAGVGVAGLSDAVGSSVSDVAKLLKVRKMQRDMIKKMQDLSGGIPLYQMPYGFDQIMMKLMGLGGGTP